MRNVTMKVLLALATVGLMSVGTQAAPLQLGEKQLDSVAAGGVEKVEGFVCPTITQTAVGENNPKAVPLGDTGDYTIGPSTGASGGTVLIPVHATNGDGYGTPGGWHAQPGDTDYTAIWARQ